ncbi:uncharacterized protein BZB76_5660 [Actinomadura pelletieri DSM 43383]|uniref:DUF418 domain-containing protein n=1 Tax=Actinomadura pelletieri DSM 43383 TaxID=1120940 RepID=A0A495QH06_9ACTN|nr:DUF418 domain-containing protein [Actinomadura pelletieri]RKS71174.1 uncharacterized protein BZB76_5660 [Actinomadura pelletieri DSM 43383]
MDALRGFALFGILMVNITYMASAYHGTGLKDPGLGGPVSTAVRWFVTVFFEAKFFLLFSFLFGYSFTLQLDSAERRGVRFTPRFLRRLTGLFVIGAAHAVVLFPGDILTLYAVLGLILLALRRIKPATAMRTAAVTLTVTAVAYMLLAFAVAQAGGGTIPESVAVSAAQMTEDLRGGPASVIGAHLRDLPDVALLLIFFQAPSALAAFLLGLAAGRRKALATLDRRFLRRLQWAGFTIGLAGGIVYGHASLDHAGSAYQVFALGLDVISAPLLAAAYAATVLRIIEGSGGRPLVNALAPAGRMSLTNYLTQSLVGALVFTGFGAALIGRVAPLGVAAIAVTLFAAQMVISRWWLRHHAYGPLEWLLRAWTALSIPPWRPTPTIAPRPDHAAGGTPPAPG